MAATSTQLLRKLAENDEIDARVPCVNDPSVIRAVNAAARAKYGERWPKDANSFIGLSRQHTTLRLIPQ